MSSRRMMSGTLIPLVGSLLEINETLQFLSSAP